MINSKLSLKNIREEESDEEDRLIKAKRNDVEIPMADVDLKLAEKLDNILRISSGPSKPKFLTNKTKEDHDNSKLPIRRTIKDPNATDKVLTRRNLTKEQLRERLMKKYETLVPELDPKRTNVKVVKILSANESIELGKDQAKKQMERQMELNSISANQLAHKSSFKSFKFNDGYEQYVKTKTKALTDKHNQESKSVRFATGEDCVKQPSDDEGDEEEVDADSSDDTDDADIGLESD